MQHSTPRRVREAGSLHERVLCRAVPCGTDATKRSTVPWLVSGAGGWSLAGSLVSLRSTTPRCFRTASRGLEGRCGRRSRRVQCCAVRSGRNEAADLAAASQRWGGGAPRAHRRASMAGDRPLLRLSHAPPFCGVSEAKRCQAAAPADLRPSEGARRRPSPPSGTTDTGAPRWLATALFCA